jgi:hypothetical protein
MTTTAEVSQWTPYLADNSLGSLSGSFADFDIAIPGGSYGLRDPNVITFADGTPYVRDGKYWITYTVPDAVGSYSGNHMAVASFDPVSYHLEHTADIFFRPGVGLATNIYAGQLLYDPAVDRWRVVVSTWGPLVASPSDQVLRMGSTQRDICYGTHLINVTVPTIPQPGGVPVIYDPNLRYDGSLWQLIATANNGTGGQNFPALWTSPDLVTWTNVAWNTAHAAEGCRWAKVGGVWYALAAGLGSGDVHDFLCYDANLNYLGNLSLWSAGFDSLDGFQGNDSGPAPHPCLIPVEDDDRTRYVLITFDRSNYGAGKAATGAALVMEAAQIPTGHEFDRKYLTRGG